MGCNGPDYLISDQEDYGRYLIWCPKSPHTPIDMPKLPDNFLRPQQGSELTPLLEDSSTYDSATDQMVAQGISFVTPSRTVLTFQGQSHAHP